MAFWHEIKQELTALNKAGDSYTVSLGTTNGTIYREKTVVSIFDALKIGGGAQSGSTRWLANQTTIINPEHINWIEIHKD